MAQVVPIDAAREPPHNLEAEESVLGAMMISAGAIGAVIEILDASDFYRETHAKIYRAAVRLYASGLPVDAIALVNELEKHGELTEAGGRDRIIELAALVPASANAAHWAEIVHEMAILRGLARVGLEISRMAIDRGAETPELLARAEQLVFELASGRKQQNLIIFKEALLETFRHVSELYESNEEVTGVPSGFRELDRITAGFQPGNLIVLAARPSMGKSGLGLSIAANVVRKKLPCVLFSLEMSRTEIAQRLMCMEAKVDSHHLRIGKLSPDEWPRLAQACAKLEDVPLWVDDTPILSLLELRSRVQTLKRREPDLALVVVDYLQLMTSGVTEESRLQEVSAISRGLKAIARDIDVPVLALSQLSRAVEQRTDKRPILSDLRESGGIEQDSDVVMFIYRDDYYNKDSEHAGVAEVHVAKHRNGPTDTIQLAFLRRYVKFSSVQP